MQPDGRRWGPSVTKTRWVGTGVLDKKAESSDPLPNASRSGLDPDRHPLSAICDFAVELPVEILTQVTALKLTRCSDEAESLSVRHPKGPLFPF